MSKYTRSLQEKILNGKLEEADRGLYGTYNGYHVLVSFERDMRVKIDVCSDKEENEKDLEAYIKELIGKSGIVENDSYFDARYYEVNLGVRVSGKEEIDAQRISTTIKNLTEFLSDHEFADCCPLCGKQEDDRVLAEIDGFYAYICKDCAEKFDDNAEKTGNRAKMSDDLGGEAVSDDLGGDRGVKPKKVGSHVIPGTLGAILGFLVGIGFWMLMKDEYYASATTFLSVFLIVTLYAKFAKGMDRTGVVICSVIIFLGAVTGPYMGWSCSAYEGLKEFGYTFWECFRYLISIISVSELAGSFIIDLVLSLVFSGIAGFGYIKTTMKERFGKKTFRILKK